MKHLLTLWLALGSVFLGLGQTDSILIDFGNTFSPPPWNNLADPDSGQIADLTNALGNPTGFSIRVFDPFNNINTAGTTTPDPSTGLPGSATGDSIFGNTAPFGGATEPTGGVLLSQLDTSRAYTLRFFASRINVTDNREAQYVVAGATTDTLYLDAANNTANLVATTLFPDSSGEIRITAAPGPNNTNGSGFYYLGSLTVSYAFIPPPVALDSILIDFGAVSSLSAAPWNNLIDADSGQIADLSNTLGNPTGFSISVFDPFNNSNTAGTTTPDPSTGLPGSATGDSFFGNTAPFAGATEPTGGLLLSQLDTSRAYTLSFFASRINVTDNREAQYVVEGATTDTLYLDAANNSADLVATTLLPDSSGQIRITAAPGPNNTNGSGFYYLGSLTVAYPEITPPPPPISLVDSIQIDFGAVSSLTPAPWNNVTDAAAGEVTNLLNQAGDSTGYRLAIVDPFNNSNTAGTLSPDPSTGLPASATGDSFFGNTAPFGGATEPTGGLLLSQLDPSLPYTLRFFASRTNVTDNREAQYVVEGATTDTLYLDAANNSADLVATTLLPDSSGQIRITAAPGPNNTNGSGFYYLGSLTVAYPQVVPVSLRDTILVDLGNTPSPAPWNNIGDPVAGEINDLLNSRGQFTGRRVALSDPFNNINTNGTLAPDPATGFPATATGDSFFGNTAPFGGQTQPTAGVTFSQLDTAKAYHLRLFASRMAVSDNRETQYLVAGATLDTLYLDAANNVDQVAETLVQPDSSGQIVITASPGPNNTNGNGFYYLGALQLIYDREENTAPATLSLTAPAAGAHWQAGKTPEIRWQARNTGLVTLDYSTDNGTTWLPIDTVPGFLQRYPWTVPASPSTACLVRATSDSLVSVSAPFTMSLDTTACRIVVLGSSTAAGTGASPSDSAWVNRYRDTLFQYQTRFQVTNLARGGYTTYHILPTGTPIPGGVNVTIDQARNITAALAEAPYAVIVNMPSNDAANNYGAEAQLVNFDLIKATGEAGGARVWIATPQPRNFTNAAQVDIQRTVRDSVLARYGADALDFWNGLALANGFIDPAFDSGDGVHLNNAGHWLLTSRVLAAGIDTLSCVPTTVAIAPPLLAGGLRVYPNPYRDHVILAFESAAAGTVSLRWVDVLGRTEGEVSAVVPHAGAHEIRLDLPAGGPALRFGIVTIQTPQGSQHQPVKLVRQAE